MRNLNASHDRARSHSTDDRDPSCVLPARIIRTDFPPQLPVQVNQSALCVPAVPLTHSDAAPLSLLARLMTHGFLHPEIREKGACYLPRAAAIA